MNNAREVVTEEERYFSKSYEGKELPMGKVFYPKGYKEWVQGRNVENMLL